MSLSLLAGQVRLDVTSEDILDAIQILFVCRHFIKTSSEFKGNCKFLADTSKTVLILLSVNQILASLH